MSRPCFVTYRPTLFVPMISDKAIPVAFIIFNRPDKTQQVFGKIREWAPHTLYVIADGPRAGSEQDTLRCAAARAIIDEGVDWPCTVIKLYAEENMGCGRRIVSGIQHIFEIENRAIILEDDCLPDLSFFSFCAELLERYKEHPEIMHICGHTWDLSTLPETPDSYFFSRFPLCWGWATWKRAWKCMQWDAPDWLQERNDKKFFSSFHDKNQKQRIRKQWDALFLEGHNSWAYRWHYALYKKKGLSIVPVKNLVVNIGCGLSGTHTQGDQIAAHSYAQESLSFPLHHPQEIKVNLLYDAYYESLNTRFYTHTINVAAFLKSFLRHIRHRLLRLSSWLNPKIRLTSERRRRTLEVLFPETDIASAPVYPSVYATYRALSLIHQQSPMHIVELGSGLSTLYLLQETYTLSQPPQITTFTSNNQALKLTELGIKRFSQQNNARCFLAPLEPNSTSLDGSFGYAPRVIESAIKEKPPIDFLWIHGPIDAVAPSSWPLYTEIPMLRGYLAPHCCIVICPLTMMQAILLTESLRKELGLSFKNEYAPYHCLVHSS